MYYKTAFLRGKKPPFRGVFKYKDSDGEWRQTVRTLEAKGKAEAKRELLEVRLKLEQEHERLEWESRESMTVYEYVESYIKSFEDVRALERSTVSIYGYLLKHIRDGIGNVRLTQLKADQVQAWEAMMIADGLSASSVRKVHNLLKSALRHAVDTDLLSKNPIAAVRPPKLDAALPNALADSQRRALLTYLDAASSTPFNLAVFIAISTGMREGEICGLRWSDVSFETRTIWVRRSIARYNGTNYVKQPKTRGSIRDVPMASALADALRKRKAAQSTELVVAGLAPTEDRMAGLYVLGGVDGSFMSPAMVSKGWRTLSDSMGLVGTQGKRPTFHDLRHTFATYAIAEGVDVKTVSSILGHSNAAMTLNIYASADPNSKRAAAATIDDVVGRRLSKQEIEAYADAGRY